MLRKLTACLMAGLLLGSVAMGMVACVTSSPDQPHTETTATTDASTHVTTPVTTHVTMEAPDTETPTEAETEDTPDIEIVEVTGGTYKGYMMIVKDPSRVIVGTCANTFCALPPTSAR